jgi:dephospho-CoA kinase
MILVAITGVVCSGKSFVGKIVARLGYQVFSCDEEIGKILKQKVVLNYIKQAFPTVMTDNGLDKKLLAEIIFNNPKSKETLEGILYPKLFARQSSFISSLRARRTTHNASSQRKLGSSTFPSESWEPSSTRKAGSSGQARGKGLDPSFRWDDACVVKRFQDKIAFFEVPLLYEKGLEDQYDVVITTRVPSGVLVKRANERGIDQKVFSNILRNQLSSREKEKRADYVLDTNVSAVALEKKIKRIIGELCKEK